MGFRSQEIRPRPAVAVALSLATGTPLAFLTVIFRSPEPPGNSWAVVVAAVVVSATAEVAWAEPEPVPLEVQAAKATLVTKAAPTTTPVATRAWRRRIENVLSGERGTRSGPPSVASLTPEFSTGTEGSFRTFLPPS